MRFLRLLGVLPDSRKEKEPKLTKTLKKKSMDGFSFHNDDYALTILHQAAAAMRNTSDTGTSNTSSSEHPGTSQDQLPKAADGRGSPNQHANVLQHLPHRLDVSQSRSGLNNYVLPTSRNMETLSFNPGYHVASQMSQNFGNHSLGILNAESYDDGRLSITTQEARVRNQHDQVLPFGIANTPELRLDLDMRTNSDDYEKGAKRRKKHKIDTQNANEDEEARKKARGRPRVDTKDETAADVSFTTFFQFGLSLSLSSRVSQNGTFLLFLKTLKDLISNCLLFRHVKLYNSASNCV